MTRLKTLIIIMLYSGSLVAQNGKISSDERSFLKDYLTITESNLIKIIADLDDEKWNYRPSTGGWSASECMEHVILAERAVFRQVYDALAADANNSLHTENQDAWLIAKVADRGVKVKTPLPPKGSGKSKESMIEELKASRRMIHEFLEDEDLPLRNHFGRSPYGPADAYQLLLVIAAHSMRHNAQIHEILQQNLN